MSRFIQFNRIYSVAINNDGSKGYLSTFFVSAARAAVGGPFTSVWIGYPAVLRCELWSEVGWFTRVVEVSSNHLYVAWSSNTLPRNELAIVRFAHWELDPNYAHFLHSVARTEDELLIIGGCIQVVIG